MDRLTYDALAAMALAGLSSGIHAMRLMASRGLVSPQEVEEYADSILNHFTVDKSDPSHEHLAQLRERFEMRLAPAFAELRQFAKEHWIGRSKGAQP